MVDALFSQPTCKFVSKVGDNWAQTTLSPYIQNSGLALICYYR